MTAPGIGEEHTRPRKAPPYRALPPAKREEVRAWVGYPPDDERYETFVTCLLEHASIRLGVTVTNGVIDFTSRTEGSAVLRGTARGGWIDPSLEHVGSASREAIPHEVLQDLPCHVTLRQREFSMVTLDASTSFPADESQSFYSRVIKPLVNLPRRSDRVYGWLEPMFRFCASKPVVYYSQYVPGPRIHAIAGRHGVRVLHLPLRTIPPRLLERNQRFRFLWLTGRQWEALVDGVDALRRARAGLEAHEG